MKEVGKRSIVVLSMYLFLLVMICLVYHWSFVLLSSLLNVLKYCFIITLRLWKFDCLFSFLFSFVKQKSLWVYVIASFCH